MQNKSGQTSLTMLINYRLPAAAKFLIAKGANPHLEDAKGLDSCDYAEMKNYSELHQIFGCKQRNQRKMFKSRLVHNLPEQER